MTQARIRLLQERKESREALFSALVAQAANVETARAEIAALRRKADEDERRLEKSIVDLPARLKSLQAEIASLEASMESPEDILFRALFGK